MRRVSAAIILLALLALAALAVASEGGTDVAAVATAGPHDPDQGAKVSEAAKEMKSGQSQKPENPGEDAREAAEQKKETSEESGERAKNHGFYVSQAARCIDVHLSGVALPSPCEGRAKGEYVSSVARSDLGKPFATEGQQGSAPATPGAKGKGPQDR
ncbi:MAG: hypothetical protein ACRDJ4_13895 [Actinomycetota bacterium]